MRPRQPDAAVLRLMLDEAEERIAHLHVAVRSRHLIGMAQGILMARLGLTEDQSFAALCRVSSETNTKVRDIAEEVVRTGRLPVLPHRCPSPLDVR